MTDTQITDLIPHRGPMLLVDRIVNRSASSITCRKRFSGDEFFFEGHYPDFPLVPGVILCECAAQAAALLIAATSGASLPADKVPVLTRLNNVRLKKMVRPGDEIEIEVNLNEATGGAWFLSATVRVDGKLAASMELACTGAPRPEADSADKSTASRAP